jgi:lipopolysaccharide/colanic/teichoic acid biosynthesis glycosyltransferase
VDYGFYDEQPKKISREAIRFIFMLKRFFDFAISVTAISLLLPVLVIIAIGIKLSSKGPVFYRGLRIGLNGNHFRIYKFRTMVADAEKIGGPSTALDDQRLTKIGKFLRKYKLDELPQFINIIKGEMSLVGPRPQVEAYTKLYTADEKIILSVKPGLTDYSSIRFINLDSILGNNEVDRKYIQEVEPEKNKLRVKYARNHSLSVDIKIIMQTIKRLIFKG